VNRSKLIWGIICLVLAGLLAVLNVRLPADKLMFMVGSRNMPYVPVILLAIVGVALVASPSRAKAPEEKTPEIVEDPARAALNKRLETIAWGLFLIMLGGFMFVPGELIARGIWSIGVGIIMLGLNAVRYRYGLRMSGFTTFLGIVSLISGVLELLFFEAIEGAILIIVLGAYLIAKPWIDAQRLFGKAEES